MPDAPDPVDAAAAQRFDIGKVVVLSGWALTIAVCLVVIAAATWMALKSGDHDTLDKWAGLCLGFLLGSFVTMVRDFIKVGS